ncbi:MAG: cytochrome b [Hyphomicrobiales bacterium]|nr:cytochrome b [Hyphomicrobiales bacterium]MDE2114915.1 cytochrome b [Hyphomicrobiales bacterium]
MPPKNEVATTSYSPIAIGLHWLIALIIVFQFFVGLIFDDFQKPLKGDMINLHAAIGLTLLILVAFRLYWRLTHVVPALPSSVPHLQALISKAGHYLLYILMFAVPIVGMMTRFARGAGINFGLFNIASPWAVNKPFAETTENLHGLLAYILVGVAALHLLAGLYHYFFLKDGVMNRMMRSSQAS